MDIATAQNHRRIGLTVLRPGNQHLTFIRLIFFAQSDQNRTNTMILRTARITEIGTQWRPNLNRFVQSPQLEQGIVKQRLRLIQRQFQLIGHQGEQRIQLLNARLAELQEQLRARQETKKSTH